MSVSQNSERLLGQDTLWLRSANWRISSSLATTGLSVGLRISRYHCEDKETCESPLSFGEHLPTHHGLGRLDMRNKGHCQFDA